MSFRFHVLGLPHTVTNKEYVACAYTQKVLKLCKMLKKRGHTVFHYGHEDSDVVCDEHITVVGNRDLEIAYGNYDWKKNFFRFDMSDHAYTTFYKNSISEIKKRKKPLDFLLAMWGYGHKPVCDAHNDLIVVEPGIGYGSGHFAKFRIYESHAIRNAINGATSVMQTGLEDWYHVVIPNYFEPEDLEYDDIKEDYFLFLGRVYPGKGVDIAYQVCDSLGEKLILAGQGSLEEMGYENKPGRIEHIGYADVKLRNMLMKKAKGFFLPSMYNEPFGGSSVEAMFCGTPIITTDWGVFAETNVHGYTGYRCRTFDHFCWAAENIRNIKPINCRNWAMENYTCDRVSEMYEEYWQMVMDIYTGKGWYERHPQRKNLDWLKKTYPW